MWLMASLFYFVVCIDVIKLVVLIGMTGVDIHYLVYITELG